MADTRREMTRAEFASAAAYAHDGWWLTGEEAFVHGSPATQIEGWNVYGHIGNQQLTEPQRVLMMWSDLVGQTVNGGITQFIDNFANQLALAHRLIAKLEWPELFERFDLAFREQAGEPGNPQPRRAVWGPEDDAAYGADRQRRIRALARRKTKWQPWARRREMEALERLSDRFIFGLYDKAVEAGEIVLDEVPPDSIVRRRFGEGFIKYSPDAEPVPSEAADAFNDWFYLDETKAASRVFIRNYILRHRDELCRLSD